MTDTPPCILVACAHCRWHAHCQLCPHKRRKTRCKECVWPDAENPGATMIEEDLYVPAHIAPQPDRADSGRLGLCAIPARNRCCCAFPYICFHLYRFVHRRISVSSAFAARPTKKDRTAKQMAIQNRAFIARGSTELMHSGGQCIFLHMQLRQHRSRTIHI